MKEFAAAEIKSILIKKDHYLIDRKDRNYKATIKKRGCALF
jgi:hypothetical protein